jgi:hypothetical protein
MADPPQPTIIIPGDLCGKNGFRVNPAVSGSSRRV